MLKSWKARAELSVAFPLPLSSAKGEDVAGQCSILYINAINSDGFAETHTGALRSLGFDVVETKDLPAARGALTRYHALVVRVPEGSKLPSIATRLRAAPLFGRRVLISLVPGAVTARQRREAVDSGFDRVLPAECSARILAAAILAILRKYPEHRCVVRGHGNRRRAVA